MALAEFLRSLASPFLRRTVAPPGAPTAAPTPQRTAGGPDGDLKGWARATVEKVRTAWLAGRFHLLPYLDLYTEETDEIRAAYPVMLREPTLQSALLGQVNAVASQEAQVHPDDPDDPRQAMAAKAALHALKKLHGGSEWLPIGSGPRHVAWSVLSGAVLKGWSLCELTLRKQPERTGPAKGKVIWESFKAKDVDSVQLVTDRFWGITGVKALRYNPGVVFEGPDLHSFVVFNRLSLYEHPTGISAFRACYRAFWIKDTAWKLRALHLDRFTHPYLVGTYTAQDQKAALEEALQEMHGAGWATVPVGALVTPLDLATRGTADFDAAIRDCNEEMLTGVCGAYLHMMTGQSGQQRGSSEVQQDTTEGFQEALSACLGDTVTAQMLKPWYAFNYHDMEPGQCTWGAVSEQALMARANLDKTLKDIGLELSKKEAYAYYGRQRPADRDDVLGGDEGGGGGPGGGGPGGPGGGGGGDQGQGDAWSGFGEWDESKHARDKGRFAHTAGAAGTLSRPTSKGTPEHKEWKRAVKQATRAALEAEGVTAAKADLDEWPRKVAKSAPHLEGLKRQDVLDALAGLKREEWAARESETRPSEEEPVAAHQGLYPDGFRQPSHLSIPNPKLPDEARPKLTLEEARAALTYSQEDYERLNSALRGGSPLPGDLGTTHAGLASAFAKASPLPEPVAVQRGLNFTSPQDLGAFVGLLRQAREEGRSVQLPGYQSTTTDPSYAFKGNVKMTIAARKGLDLRPYSLGGEEEMLLDHDSRFAVRDLKETAPGRWEITLEQQP
jgi:hypothetical protein